MKRILITGAGGQIGSWLVPRLRELYGEADVLATDVRPLGPEFTDSGPFQVLDATDAKAVGQCVMRHRADTVYHLAAILSAIGEKDPRLAWHVNMASLEAVLEVARLKMPDPYSLHSKRPDPLITKDRVIPVSERMRADETAWFGACGCVCVCACANFGDASENP